MCDSVLSCCMLGSSAAPEGIHDGYGAAHDEHLPQHLHQHGAVGAASTRRGRRARPGRDDERREHRRLDRRPPAVHRGRARHWITEYAPAERAAGRGLDLAVTEFLTQRLVGIVQLTNTDWHIRATELSYIVAPWARGEGYASESALATAQWLFGDQKFERIEIRTAADNAASQQVAQKIGCISEGVLRNACIVHVRAEDGTWTDLRSDFIVWSLLPEDLEGADEQLAGFTAYSDWN